MYLLHHLLEAAAAEYPDKEAIVDRDRRFTYDQFAAAARSCAARLQARGLRRGDRVGLYVSKSFEECAGIFGVSMAGGVVVPINVLLRPRQVEHVVQDGGLRYLITDSKRRETLPQMPSLEAVLLPDEAFSGTPSSVPQSPAIGEDLAALLYTSGSTGKPKGVMVSHRNLLAGSRIVSEYVGIEHTDRLLSVLPFSFDYGLNQLITATEQGATTVLLTFRFGNDIVRCLESERISGFAGVPTIWALLTRTASFTKTPLPALRYLTNSGGAVPTETVNNLREVLPHTNLILMYGLTEAFRSTYLPPDQVAARPTSIGKAIPETEILVVNAEGQPCAPGEIGTLVHRGPTVSLGYWNRPEDTAAVLRPNPFIPANQGGEVVCYSGDLVKKDEEGYLYFVGRGDAMIKCQGYRVSPTEVEEVLMKSGRLSQAAVIGLPDPNAGQRVHAIVVPLADASPDRDPLLELCSSELPPHMVPRDVEFVDDLPRSPNGKVDYKTLKKERLEGGAA